MSPIMIALLLLLAGLVLVVLEMFLPTAGVLGVLAAALLIGSVVYAYMKCDMATGTAFLAATVVMVPLLIGMAIRIWPHTPIGRMILLDPPTEGEAENPLAVRRTALVGQQGIARSSLLPGGVAEIDGEMYDVIILGPAADRGDLIEVVEVEGNRILVTLADEDEVEENEPAQEPKSLESLTSDLFEEDPFA